MDKKEVRKTIRFDGELWDEIERIAPQVPRDRETGRTEPGAQAVRYLCRKALGMTSPEEEPVRRAGLWLTGFSPAMRRAIYAAAEAVRAAAGDEQDIPEWLDGHGTGRGDYSKRTRRR